MSPAGADRRRSGGRPGGKRANPATETTNILMAGVGGQGVLVASETLALAALADGLEVKQSEVHGVAQRGGSVVSHVRFGPRVRSPLIRCGDADLLFAAERLEALRYAHHVKPGGTFVMDDRAIQPIHLPDEPEQPYPENVPEFLRGEAYEVHVIPALQTAIELGDQRCANIVLLGALASCLELDDASWEAALEKRMKPKILDLNRRAFAMGRNLGVPATR